MVRRAQQAPVTAQMYRHFAVFTLVATGMMAMLFNEDTQEAVAREVEHAGKPERAAHPTEFVRKDPASTGRFGSDDWADGAFGEPTDRLGASVSAGGIMPDTLIDTHAGLPVGYTIYGVSSETWAKLSEEERKKLVAEYDAAKNAATKAERAGEIEALQAASRARSGAATPIA